MDSEELRPITLEALKKFPKTSSLQLISLIDLVDKIAYNKGFYRDVRPWLSGLSGIEKHMPKEDREKVRQILWEFILQGILTIGYNELNPNFPFLSITQHGEKVLESGEILPYDPDGYLRKLKAEIPTLDPIIETYVTESLQAYLKGLMFSSAVTLGVASEKAILILLETLTNSIKEPKEQAKFLRLQNSFRTKNKFDQLKAKIMSVRGVFPRQLSEDLESKFDGIFNLIRITRNDAGHPTGRKIERDTTFVNLRLFLIYCKKIYDLIGYFNSNKI